MSLKTIRFSDVLLAASKDGDLNQIKDIIESGQVSERLYSYTSRTTELILMKFSMIYLIYKFFR